MGISSMIQEEKKPVSLFISKSSLTTESNKTGSWRFLRPRYHEKTAPCGVACPAGEDISRIELLTGHGHVQEAWNTILYENPFPAVCGRVCFHPCEKACNRREFDDAIAIHTVERFLADSAIRNGWKPSLQERPARKEKIAVLGAGPGGLAAAYFLAQLGYPCEVFEAMPEPGGALGWGIPSYRLAAAALKEEIARIIGLGVRIYCEAALSEASLAEVRATHDAVLLMCGHGRGGRLNVPGESGGTVKDGLALLQRVREGNAPVLEGKVAVIGGGNTAIDVARCAVRLGAKAVIVCQHRRQDMSAFENEIKMALEEGVELLELVSPVRIDAEDREVVLTLQHMKVLNGDAPREMHISPASGATETLRVSRLFAAADPEAAEAWMNPPTSGEGLLSLPQTRMLLTAQGFPMVYGADLITPVKSVAHAVASGKEAALALDILFREGFEAIQPRLADCRVGDGPSLSMEIYLGGERSQRSSHVVGYHEINIDYFQFTPRVAQPRLLKEERVRSFAEVDLRISANLAMQEASRCFNCGLCNQCDNCRLFCPDLAVKRDESPGGRSIDYDYCKGCGICVVECPRNAMSLEEEGAG
jgi:NADPH-dependent glutamate synthase beta subunit-like oxidoreductase